MKIGGYGFREGQASLVAGRAYVHRGLSKRNASGYDGQTGTRLAHLSTGATATTERSIQGDTGDLNFNRNTP